MKLILCIAPILVPLIRHLDFDQFESNDWFATTMRWNSHAGLRDTLFWVRKILWQKDLEYSSLLFGNNQCIHSPFLLDSQVFAFLTRVLHSFKRIQWHARCSRSIRVKKLSTFSAFANHYYSDSCLEPLDRWNLFSLTFLDSVRNHPKMSNSPA